MISTGILNRLPRPPTVDNVQMTTYRCQEAILIKSLRAPKPMWELPLWPARGFSVLHDQTIWMGRPAMIVSVLQDQKFLGFSRSVRSIQW